MKREAIADKLMLLGIDAMDPGLTRKYMARGVMPNVEKLMQRGSCREDLVLLGAQPTITPPCWTTLSTGAYPGTHGITCFKKQGAELDDLVYGMSSTVCKAEQLWDCFVEAGKKTLVCQWPGCSWPPTKEDENLLVIDGTQPTFINMLPIIDIEEVIMADVRTEEVTFKPMAASDGNVPCVIKDLEEVELGATFKDGGHLNNTILILNPEDGEHSLSDSPFNIAFSPIKDAEGWVASPAGAKEFVVLLNMGFIRRPCLVLQNEQGVYDHVAMYKSKKSTEPIVTLYKDQYLRDVWDEVIDGEVAKPATRDMMLLEIAADGTHVEMWATGALKPDYDDHFYPKSLYQELSEAIGPVPTMSNISGYSEKFLGECHMGAWEHEGDWQAAAIHYLIEKQGVEVVFSHFHNVDQLAHQMMKFLKEREYSKMPPETYDRLLQKVYEQTDRYIGKYPLTNIGVLLYLHPEVKKNIREIVMMAGAYYMHYRELNVRSDPEAANIVFTSGLPIRAGAWTSPPAARWTTSWWTFWRTAASPVQSSCPSCCCATRKTAAATPSSTTPWPCSRSATGTCWNFPARTSR